MTQIAAAENFPAKICRAPLKANQGVMTEAPESELWMRANDDVHRTASEIVQELEDSLWVDLACIGAPCVNQAIKSIAVARERLAKKAKDINVQPWFSTITDDQDRKRTRVILRLNTFAI